MAAYRRISRRSFLGRVLGGGALAVLAGAAAAQPCTDHDRGRPLRPGQRQCARPVDGCTDRDAADAPGRGRCGRRRRRGACRDRDPHDVTDSGRSCR